MFIDNFVPAINESELKEGTMKLVNVASKEILLARIGNEVYGVSHICPCRKCDLAKRKTRRIHNHLSLSRMEI